MTARPRSPCPPLSSSPIGPASELRRIQISPLPGSRDSVDEPEQVIVYQSPTFRFADSAGGRLQFASSPPPPSVALPSRSGTTSPLSSFQIPGPYQLVEGGRPVKAEVKLMVKTADAGKQAVEIRSIREFVDLPDSNDGSLISGQPPPLSGPFSRIFQQASSPPPMLRFPSASSSSPASSGSPVSSPSSPNLSPLLTDRRHQRKTRRALLAQHTQLHGPSSANLGKNSRSSQGPNESTN